MRKAILTGLLTSIVACSNLSGETNAPTIMAAPVFKTGTFPGTRSYTNYVEIPAVFPTTGVYYLEFNQNPLNTNGWNKFGKTNAVSVSTPNVTKYLSEIFPTNLSKMSNLYFRIRGEY